MDTTKNTEATMARINGSMVAVPDGAVAYKYADPTEAARWIYDVAEAKDIEGEDPSLIVWAVE